MGNTAKADANSAEVQERARQALELRKKRLSYEEIGTALGLSKSRAYQLVKGAIDAIPKEAAAEVLALELSTLDKLEAAYMPIALKGAEVQEKLSLDENGEAVGIRELVIPETTKNAAAIVLKVLERRAKYLGLDAPEKHQVSADVAHASPTEAARLVREMFGEKAAQTANAPTASDVPESPTE